MVVGHLMMLPSLSNEALIRRIFRQEVLTLVQPCSSITGEAGQLGVLFSLF